MKRKCITTSRTMKRPRQTISETLIQQHKYDDDREDKISQLPEPILHHILSFLPTFDATKTSTLSKTWYSTWKSFPIPIFSQHAFQQQSTTFRNKTPKKFKKVIQDFTDFVDTSMNRLDNIRDFNLAVDSKGFKLTRDNNNSTIERWLNYAINKNVQHLDLLYVLMKPKVTSRKGHVGWPYILPQSILEARSLKTLDLFGCKFIKPGGLNGTKIGLSLRKLSLTLVHIDQNTLENVVSSSCGLLEELAIKQCTGFETVKISGLSRLEKADLYLARDEAQIVALEAPNLKSISYGGDFDNVNASIVGSRFEKITQVLIHDVWIKDDKLFRVIISEFGSIVKTTLERCNLSKSIIRVPSNIRSSICDCH